jgi:diaminohydroxyphosphoribosylaminopyrimidine deaminase/5-amino-6-(5-phosphoribosylamino)uracil reductase
MSHALQLARRGLYTTDPNPRVGCILVNGNEVIAEGWHQIAGSPHAEINALQQAGKKAKEADCYVTLEPCVHTGKTPPCTDALIKAGIKCVIAATVDPNPEVSGKGLEKLQAAGIETDVGLMQIQSQALNPGFESRMKKGRPFVRCKLAMSLDGRTAMATNDENQWISGEASRSDVQRLRARSSAVMTGINTILADDPSLDVREIDTQGRQPLRVILDAKLRMPTAAKLLSLPGETLIFTESKDKNKQTNLKEIGANVIQLNSHGKKEFLNSVLKYIADEKEVNEVLLETGAILAGSMLEAGLIDEIIVYIAPVLMGHDARSLFQLPAIKTMTDRVQLEFSDIRMIGQDCRMTATINY